MQLSKISILKEDYSLCDNKGAGSNRHLNKRYVCLGNETKDGEFNRFRPINLFNFNLRCTPTVLNIPIVSTTIGTKCIDLSHLYSLFS